MNKMCKIDSMEIYFDTKQVLFIYFSKVLANQISFLTKQPINLQAHCSLSNQKCTGEDGILSLSRNLKANFFLIYGKNKSDTILSYCEPTPLFSSVLSPV